MTYIPLEHPNIIPVTVVAAFAILVIKESLEGVRRFSSNRRKLKAIKHMLAVECELNNWSLKWLKDHIPEIKKAIEKKWPITIRVTFSKENRLFIETDDGTSSSLVPKVHKNNVEKYLFDAASLDRKLFKKMEKALDCIIELEHLCAGVPEYVIENQVWLEGWTGYAEREIPEIEQEIAALHKECTGKPLTGWRLR